MILTREVRTVDKYYNKLKLNNVLIAAYNYIKVCYKQSIKCL